jgi:hypothetical protein
MEVNGELNINRFTPAEEPRYAFNTGLGGPQSWSVRFGEEKNRLFLPDFEHRIVHPVA